jgi:hypothetical protein
VGGYCDQEGGFWGFHSNLDRQICQELNAIRSEYQGKLLFETDSGRAGGQVANSARNILTSVGLIEDQLEAGETCLTLGRATPPTIPVGLGLWGIAHRIIIGDWEFHGATDFAYTHLCTEWANRLEQLRGELEAQLAWAGDTGRAETVAAIGDQARGIGEEARKVTDIGPGTWCDNAPEVCGTLQAVGWLLAAYVGFQVLKEIR